MRSIRMTFTDAFCRALAAARPPNPPPTMTTTGRWSLISKKSSPGRYLLVTKAAPIEDKLKHVPTNSGE